MRRGTIRGILIGAYLLAMGIALILGLTIYSKVTAEDRMAKDYLEEVEMTKTSENLMSLLVGKVIDNSLELALSTEIEEVLVNSEEESEKALSKNMNSWLLRNPEVSSIHLMDLKGNMISECNTSMNVKQEAKFKKQFTNALVWQVHQRKGQYYVGIGDNFTDERYNSTLYVARRINSANELKAIGYLYIFLDEKVIEDKLSTYLERNDLSILLVDSFRHTLTIGKAKSLEELYTNYLKEEGDGESKRAWESLYHHAEIESPELGIIFMGKRNIENKDTGMLNVVIGFSFINLIFITVGIVVVRKIIIMPLEEIANKAKRITEEKDLSIRFEPQTLYIETRFISEALNEMLDKIHSYIKESEERKRMQRILELSVISHQVNPHFLFNTLNSVNVLISVEDKETAIKLVKHLARYYRACLSQENNMNTIEQEMTLLREYIDIIQLKNPDLIRFHVEVDETLYSKKIPRMILQTLVENCIKYGIKTIEEPLKIDLSILPNEMRKCMVISVRDNGKGMEESTRLDILEGKILKEKSGFGLRSTIKRISLMYEIKNPSEILDIRSKINEYTEIKVYVPWEIKQESTTSSAI